MKFKLIKTEEEYKKAVEYLENIGDREDFQDNQELIEEFELIESLIQMYDKQHYPVGHGDPIEIIKLKMDYMGIKRKNLEHIASSGVLSEVFNRKRTLSKNMIREFALLLEIDQSLLNIPYVLDEAEPIKAISKIVRKNRDSFKFLKQNRPDIIDFKRRVTGNGMLLNVACVQ